MQRALVLLALVVAIAGCSAGAGDRGTVAGNLIQVGGPALVVDGRPMQPKPVPLAGQVVARSQTGGAFTVAVGKSGRFEMLLPPGTYRLTGYSPMYPGPCAGESAIKVRVGRNVTHISVICVAA